MGVRLPDNEELLGEVTLSIARPARSLATAILAHGAGGTMETPSIRDLQRGLAERGVAAARFNFLYSETGKRSPDKPERLEACWRSVADRVRRALSPKKLFLGGRSMGGRIASHLGAEGYPCQGLFFLAYPLHPPGKTDRQRKDHLTKIGVPMLFVSGTRDSFAELDLLRPVVKRLDARLHLLEGADHGFKVPKKLGRTPAEVNEEVLGELVKFFTDVKKET